MLVYYEHCSPVNPVKPLSKLFYAKCMLNETNNKLIYIYVYIYIFICINIISVIKACVPQGVTCVLQVHSCVSHVALFHLPTSL